MKNLITTAYLVAWAAIYTSPTCAMPFQLDFSAHWGQSAALLEFDFGGTDSISIASIFINEEAADAVTGRQASAQNSGHAGQDLFASSAIAGTDRPDINRLSARLDVSELAGVLPLSVSSQTADDMNGDYAGMAGQVVIEKEDLHFYSPASPTDSYAVLAMAGTGAQTERAGVSFKSLAEKQVRTRAVPDPSPVWLVGLVLGISGITWRLWNLVKVAE